MKRFIIGGIGIATICVLMLFLYFNSKEKEEIRVATKDELKLKSDYESLNETIASNGKNYPLVSIPEFSGVKIIDESEAVNVIKNKTGVIFFGFESCPWCRNALPVLINALQNNGIQEFFYDNLLDTRDTYELDAKNKPKRTKEGSAGYYELLKVLKSYLDDYTLTVKSGKDKGKIIKTGEKRILVPLVVFVKAGKVVGVYDDTVPSQKDPYILLNKEQKEELNKIYSDYIATVYDASCPIDEEVGC